MHDPWWGWGLLHAINNNQDLANDDDNHDDDNHDDDNHDDDNNVDDNGDVNMVMMWETLCGMEACCMQGKLMM